MTEKTSSAKQMALILGQSAEPAKALPRPPAKAPQVEAQPAKPEPQENRGFGLRGYLYRKFFRKEEKKQLGRVGQALGLMKKPPSFPKFEIYPHKRLTTVVPIKNLKLKPMIYPLLKPYSYARIKVGADESMVYDISEPQLSSGEQHGLEKLKEGLIQVINVRFEDIRKHKKM